MISRWTLPLPYVPAKIEACPCRLTSAPGECLWYCWDEEEPLGKSCVLIGCPGRKAGARKEDFGSQRRIVNESVVQTSLNQLRVVEITYDKSFELQATDDHLMHEKRGNLTIRTPEPHCSGSVPSPVFVYSSVSDLRLIIWTLSLPRYNFSIILKRCTMQ